ncbi:MAG: 3-hydroxy-5-phosphonooxypentane-2,4-dione thiolase [bacterium]
MDWGLSNRINRIFNKETGRTVMLAVDHGYFLGPISGLETPSKTVTPLIEYADSLMLTRGILRTSVKPDNNIPIVLRVSGGTSILDEDLSNEGITTSIKEAVRLNASAVALSIFVGAPNEKETLLNLAKLVDEAEEYGIAVLAVTAVGKNMVRDVRYLALACRIAAEIGAHIVKTYYCEEFEKVIESCPVPIVIAGGKKLPEEEAFKLAYNAIQKGAKGVDMGRNIFQSEYPVAAMKTIKAIVHNGIGLEEACALFNKLKK